MKEDRFQLPKIIRSVGWRLAALGVLVAFQLPTDGEILLDYTASRSGTISPGVPVTYASGFTVGTQDVEITSMRFRLDGRASMSYDFTAYIFASSGDHPGALLGSSHRFFAPGDFTEQGFMFYDFDFQSPLSLSAGVSYWAGLGTSSAGYPPYIAGTGYLDNFTSYGVTPSLTWCTSSPLSYPPSGDWGVNAPDATLVYELEGTIVPEPTVWSLLFCGFLGLRFVGFIRNRATR
jgi:hypothetical protein